MTMITGDNSPEIVTEIADREQRYGRTGMTTHVPFALFPAGAYDQWTELGGREKYTFAGPPEHMQGVMDRILDLVDAGQVADAITAADESTIKNYEDKNPQEKWGHMSVQLPGDWGPQEPSDREHMRQTLTAAAHGHVLEAMCGFTSYIDDAPHIEEVVAMDFCREGLERYDRPDRTRILFDLERVCEGGEIDFLAARALDSIVITLGVDYLSKPANVYEEFDRVLAPGGNVLIVGAQIGYTELLHQYFDPKFHAGLLENSGFEVSIHPLPYGGQGDEAKYHLINAFKPRVIQDKLF